MGSESPKPNTAEAIEWTYTGEEKEELDEILNQGWVMADNQDYPHELTNLRKTWSSNNGKISFVNGGGLVYVAPDTNEREDILRKFGYKRDGGVPYSNNPPSEGSRVWNDWQRKFGNSGQQN